jgi:hypothetical protein
VLACRFAEEGEAPAEPLKARLISMTAGQQELPPTGPARRNNFTRRGAVICYASVQVISDVSSH